MIETLNAICQHAMRRPISPDDNLIRKGLNANRALKIIKAFWIETGIELDVNIFYRCASVRAIVDAISNGSLMDDSKLVKLRDGDSARPLFIYAGGVSFFLEMQELINAIRYDGVIYGIRHRDFDVCPGEPPTMAQEVEASLAAVLEVDPNGPYRLLGYSFGGVAALELARGLKAQGRDIALLVMLDSPINDHSWYWFDWLCLMRRIVSRQIRSRLSVRRRPKLASPASATDHALEQSPPRRGHQLMFRFRNPRHPEYPIFAPQWAGGHTPAYSRSARQIIQMKGLYRPRRFDDHVLFFNSKGGSPIDCDARKIWTPYLPRAEWVCSAGNHQSMIVGRNARAIAAVLDERLGSTSVNEDRDRALFG
jgi:thioesterase domain-containing protein/aryl carrier-like protein